MVILHAKVNLSGTEVLQAGPIDDQVQFLIFDLPLSAVMLLFPEQVSVSGQFQFRGGPDRCSCC